MHAAELAAGEHEWHLARLQAVLGAAGAAWQLQSCREVDSTNTELLRRVRAGLAQPCLLVAERQTAGRGRLGRTWHTAICATRGDVPALTFSVALPVQRPDWSGLSLVVGLAVVQAIQVLAGGPVAGLGLKWPNDVWREGRKLAGILIESAALPNQTGMGGRWAVVGIGINLDAPPEFATPAGGARGNAPPPVAGDGLRSWLSPHLSASAVLHALLPVLLGDLAQFDVHGFDPFQARFAASDLLVGQAVWLSDGRVGSALGVSQNGALRVVVSGVETLVSSGEVSVRPATLAPGAAAGAGHNPVSDSGRAA